MYINFVFTCLFTVKKKLFESIFSLLVGHISVVLLYRVNNIIQEIFTVLISLMSVFFVCLCELVCLFAILLLFLVLSRRFKKSIFISLMTLSINKRLFCSRSRFLPLCFLLLQLTHFS